MRIIEKQKVLRAKYRVWKLLCLKSYKQNFWATLKKVIRFKLLRYLNGVGVEKVYNKPFFTCEKIEAGEWSYLSEQGFIHKER